LINRGHAATFNQFYGVEARISPVWIEHPDIRPIIPLSVRAGFVSFEKGRITSEIGMSFSSNLRHVGTCIGDLTWKSGKHIRICKWTDGYKTVALALT
jgi:glutamate mutase epsilon subunit